MIEEQEGLAQYYVLTKSAFEELEPDGEVATAVLRDMGDEDSVMLAQVVTEEGDVAYLPILLIRDEGASAVVNMGWILEEQKDALYLCLEKLDAFTRGAYDTLGEPFPAELKDRRRRLEAALYSKGWWEPEEFDELDDALYQLETILTDIRDAEELAAAYPGFGGLDVTLEVAQRNFDVIRAVLYDDEEGEEGEEGEGGEEGDA